MEMIERLERSMLTSWPALSTAFDGDWVVRLADGVTKRSNSVTCLATDDSDLGTRIDRVVDIYRDRGLPAIFRLSPLASPALDTGLNERGWRRFDETIVMTADLDDLATRFDGDVVHPVQIAKQPDQAWLKSCYRIDGAKSGHLATLTAMLERLVPKAGYARIQGGDDIDALALMVVDQELTGLFEVLTVSGRRRQGFARALLRELFAWSRREGADTAWLAVVADNLPAKRLYQSLGFREVYRYHYRSNA
ncbi:MAG: GNAT family N-acetyltransferase [Geminicoccaceae bacterium]